MAREINLGWGDGTLMKQTGVKTKEMERLELIRNAIVVLRVHGYMAPAASDKARAKLSKAINAALQSQERAS